MVDMNNLLNLQCTIILLIAVGVILAKLGIITPTGRKSLTDLVIDFILPCNIIVSFMIEFNTQILISCLAVFLVSIGIQCVVPFMGHFFYPGTKGKRLAVLKYATIVSNAGFLGNPIVLGMYGSTGLLYASIYLIPQRIVMWSEGVACFTSAKGRGIIKKVLTHPCIIAVEIGIVFMITQVSLPKGILDAIKYSSNCNTALCMIVIGGILSEIQLNDILDKQILWFTFVRLILIPIVVLVVCRLLHLEDLVTGVCTVLAGMPAAATTAILAEKYESDSKFAVSIVCFSTLVSLVTVPLLSLLMMYV
ncbi:Malate permease [Lachnospiraceae bacterium TWA4]|nr:Malate permease [Lachnospiraceae bacterium TWA4]